MTCSLLVYHAASEVCVCVCVYVCVYVCVCTCVCVRTCMCMWKVKPSLIGLVDVYLAKVNMSIH